MGKKANTLVVDLETAAGMLLTTVSFVRGEIKDGALKGIKLGSKLVVRIEELEEYLSRKEAEGVPSPKPRPRKTKEPTPGECAQSDALAQSPDVLPNILEPLDEGQGAN